MKLIVTKNSIISLENVRRVDVHESTSKHTSHGKPYTVTDYEIFIYYMDSTTVSERIKCGEDADGRALAEKFMAQIADILSKD